MDGDQRPLDGGIEERLDRLEARIDAIERRLATPASATPMAPISSRATAPMAARAVTPAAPSSPPSAWAAYARPAHPAHPAVAPPMTTPAAPRPTTPATAEASVVLPRDVRAPAVPSRVPGPSGPRIPLPDLSGSWAELEERLAGRALAVVGGIALVLGASFFLSLAFSRGWIGPEARVLLGLVAGTVAVGGGWWFVARGNRLLGHVLLPVGIAVVEISLIGATSVYALVPAQLGLLAALVCAMAAALIAVREDSQLIAIYGLVAVLLAPPLMQAPPDLVTLLFVAAILIGTTAIALWRSWTWLPPTAFILSAPQFLAWIAGDPEPWMGLVGIAGFWLVNAIAAGGEAFRHRRDDVSPTAATLLVADAATAIVTGFLLLDGELATYRAFFLVLLALANLGLAAFFLLRDGALSLFGMLAAGTGIAALTMAAPVGLGAPAIPVAWAAEAVVLAWLAARLAHPYSGLVAGGLVILAGLAVIRATLVDTGPAPAFPFFDPAGIALGFFLIAIALAMWFLRDRTVRHLLAATGLIVATVCAIDVLEPIGIVVGGTALAVVGAATWRAVPWLPDRPIAWRFEGWLGSELAGILPRSAAVRRVLDRSLPAATVLAWLVASVAFIGPVWWDARSASAATPFVDGLGAVLVIYLVGLGATMLITGVTWLREPLAAIGLLVVAWAAAAELESLWLVAAWSALLVLGTAMWRGFAALPHEPPLALRRMGGTMVRSDALLLGAALVSGVSAAAHVLVVELPLGQFGSVTPPDIPFTDGGAVAAAILIAATLLTGALLGTPLGRRLAVGASLAIAAYTIPFEVYAWTVVVLWVGLGAVALAIGRVDRPIRQAWVLVDIGLIAAAVAVWVWIVAPPTRLVVWADGMTAMVMARSLVAGVSVVAGLGLLARDLGAHPWSRWASVASGVAFVYLLSVFVVDLVATQVGGVIGLEERRFQGQVALSVLWTILGVASLVAGMVTRHADLRHGGLALLALATAKVFLVDLSALDVAYRVISLVVLGLVLLAAAWLWQHSQPKPPVHGGMAGHPT